MAKATIKAPVTLKLTDEEVIALRDVLAHVSGFPGTRRDFIDDISTALDEAGVEYNDDMTDISGDVEFT